MTARATLERLGVRHDGHELIAATITSPSGLRMRVLNLGGIVWSLQVPDAEGALADVVLGYDDPVAYLTDAFYLGAIVGRYAGRIAGARFPLDGELVRVTANQGRNLLHGGRRGFDKVIWDMATFEAPAASGVVLTYTSPAGEEGFPGTLLTRATYSLTDDGAWEVTYHAETDRPTPVNLTQHSYFNLAGGGSAADHLLRVDADGYLPLTAEQIPKGTIAPVGGSAFDLRKARRVGDVAHAPEFGDGGLDHSFVLRSSFGEGKLMSAAELVHPASGRGLTVTTTEPSVHAYAGHYLRDVRGKAGRRYQAGDAVCLETQHFPDSPNRPSFPGTIVLPGEPLRSRTRYAFSARPPVDP
jgi:aldose 1-epimerase